MSRRPWGCTSVSFLMSFFIRRFNQQTFRYVHISRGFAARHSQSSNSQRSSTRLRKAQSRRPPTLQPVSHVTNTGYLYGARSVRTLVHREPPALNWKQGLLVCFNKFSMSLETSRLVGSCDEGLGTGTGCYESTARHRWSRT
jgi:hypothetical protein